MFLKYLFLGLVGLCAGGVIAAGIFAFIVTIGVVIRLIGKTHTGKHIRLIEDFIVAGGTLGNIVNLYEIAVPGGYPVLLLFGIGAGVFVGCLIMSLAETLNALPVLSRRIHLTTGLQYVILSIAVGKGLGAAVYFILNIH
ncbi:stage V sporulation protein AB [Qiania dongpingensis]|uniref:Stage V sporulation protein AB n=1 Tax=Qiania dongpingensis TaxID=2763669 RepID=A0A7G9G7K5_9FIRM|nr:stage V sporulation protein AB [Qiania dongpingensis]QNM06787.1 stage V sporulation protein AB [Qiania dongpingensis]